MPLDVLVNNLKSGNQLAFTSLYKQYSKEAFSLAFKYLCNKSLAEDAVQNLFLKIWINREKIDETKPFNHYLFTVLKHDLINILRDSKAEIFILDDCIEMLNSIEDTNNDAEELMNEQSRVVQLAMGYLSPQKRKIFSMKASGKYSNQEIATELDLSINTIKFQYSQSLKQIKELVRKCALMLL